MAALIAVAARRAARLRRRARRGRGADAAIRGAFQVGLSMPVFYLGLVLLTVFAAKLRWFPVGGFGETPGDHLYHLFLPALTLALSLAAVLMRNLRAAIIEVLGRRICRLRPRQGPARPRIVLVRHVLRNALISTVTLFGLRSARCSAARSSPRRCSPSRAPGG